MMLLFLVNRCIKFRKADDLSGVSGDLWIPRDVSQLIYFMERNHL